MGTALASLPRQGVCRHCPQKAVLVGLPIYPAAVSSDSWDCTIVRPIENHLLFPYESTYSAYADKSFLIGDCEYYPYNTLLRIITNHERRINLSGEKNTETPRK